MTIHSLNNNLRLFEMPIQYRDRPEGSVSKLDTVGDGIKVMSTIFRMIREYKPLPFFGTLGLIIGIIGIMLCGWVTAEFVGTGMVVHFPTLIGAIMLVIVGLLLIVTGIILDVIAKNDRKTFIVDANRFAYAKGIGPILFRLAMLHHIATTNKRDAMSCLTRFRLTAIEDLAAIPISPYTTRSPIRQHDNYTDVKSNINE